MQHASNSKPKTANKLSGIAESSKYKRGGCCLHGSDGPPNEFTFIDLFAGIGGFHLALKGIGGSCVFASEIDPTAVPVYAHNLGIAPVGDIRLIGSRVIPPHDVLCGGFPCQAFSPAGRKMGLEDPRGTLFEEIARIARDLMPSALLLENVPRLLTHDNGYAWEVIRTALVRAGYNVVEPKVLNAEEYALPQHRERVVIVAFRNVKAAAAFEYPERLPSPKPTFSSIMEHGVVEPHYYISQIALAGILNRKLEHMRKGNGFGYNVTLQTETCRALVCGGSGRERNIIYHAKDLTSAVAGVGPRHPRWMTVRECARAQGVPDWFVPYAAKSHAYRHFGNTVPVSVIKAVAQRVVEALKSVGDL